MFVADLDAPDLAAEDHHHLARSLRVRPGDPITISDGAGRWRAARFDHQPVPDGEIVTVGRPEPPIAIGFVVPKGDRPAWIVQKLVELGADVIIPLRSARSVVRWDGERGARHVDRLRRVAVEAAMQSRRVWLPRVDDVTDAAELLRSDDNVALCEPGGRPPELGSSVLLIGPEGGWDDTETAAAGRLVGLGPQVLRAETAAIAAATALMLLRNELVSRHST